MSIPAAYVVVVAIWATTPLAIKWSSEGLGPMPAAASRMLIAAVIGLALVRLLNIRMPWHRAAITSYLAAGLGIFGCMSLVYWSALYVPSGLISVLFGLSPLLSGLLAQRWLSDAPLTPARWMACAVAVSGLVTIFWRELRMEGDTWFGICLMLGAVTLFSVSAVCVKRVGVSLHPFAQTVGALLVCAPAYALSWWLIGTPATVHASAVAYAAVIYLALGGSLLGFLCYYYVLRHLPATTVALVTVITPVMALCLGAIFNNETLPMTTLIGTALIVVALTVYQVGDRMMVVVRRVANQPEA